MTNTKMDSLASTTTIRTIPRRYEARPHRFAVAKRFERRPPAGDPRSSDRSSLATAVAATAATLAVLTFTLSLDATSEIYKHLFRGLSVLSLAVTFGYVGKRGPTLRRSLHPDTNP